jgi:class 3 adenylate cyclase
MTDQKDWGRAQNPDDPNRYHSSGYHEELAVLRGDEIEAALEPHAPFDWRKRYGVDRLIQFVGTHPWSVMAVDLRASTKILQAVQPTQFAWLMHTFVNIARLSIRDGGGWFDKFTGDGFIAYWPEAFEAPDENHLFNPVIFEDVVPGLLDTFTSTFEPLFSETLGGPLPEGFGLGIGVEAGPVLLCEIAGQMTIVGLPVVGAVRMVDVAHAGEVIFDDTIGEVLMRSQDEGRYAGSGVVVDRVWREPKGQPSRFVTRLTYDPVVWHFGESAKGA